MHYRSVADLNQTIYGNLERFPADIDLVVGIPRSGLLAANLVSLALNAPLADLDGFMNGRVFSSGKTRRHAKLDRKVVSGQRVLVVDDSLRFGNAIREARAKLADFTRDYELIFCVVYGLRLEEPGVDLVLEAVPTPRMFQWNLFHHKFLEQSCVALEGIVFPARDDGAAADEEPSLDPLVVPTQPVGHLISMHHPTHRGRIEARLRELGIRYHGLHFPREHGSAPDQVAFKAQVYADTPDSLLLIEPDDAVAADVVRRVGRPVLSLESQAVLTEATVAALEERNEASRIRRAARHDIETVALRHNSRTRLHRIMQRFRMRA